MCVQFVLTSPARNLISAARLSIYPQGTTAMQVSEPNIIFVDVLDFPAADVDECDMIASELWTVPHHTTVKPNDIFVKAVSSKIRKRKRTKIAKSERTGKPVDDGQTHAAKHTYARLKEWIAQFPTPYANLDQRFQIALLLGLTARQVSDFCNNYRKRFYKTKDKTHSYVDCVRSQASGVRIV
jgi:hypothetical protein